MAEQRTLSERLRYQFRHFTALVGQAGMDAHISPDLITVLGLVFVIIASVLVAQGQFITALAILLLGMPLDVLDGAIARAMKRKNRFGGMLDSTLDRYADGFLLLGLIYYFSVHGQETELLAAGLALIGAFLVSYTRAKAESLQISCKEGLFSRFERTMIQLLMLLTGWIVPGVIILAIGNNVTALQRLWLVYQATRSDE